MIALHLSAKLFPSAAFVLFYSRHERTCFPQGEHPKAHCPFYCVYNVNTSSMLHGMSLSISTDNHPSTMPSIFYFSLHILIKVNRTQGQTTSKQKLPARPIDKEVSCGLSQCNAMVSFTFVINTEYCGLFFF